MVDQTNLRPFKVALWLSQWQQSHARCPWSSITGWTLTRRGTVRQSFARMPSTCLTMMSWSQVMLRESTLTISLLDSGKWEPWVSLTKPHLSLQRLQWHRPSTAQQRITNPAGCLPGTTWHLCKRVIWSVFTAGGKQNEGIFTKLAWSLTLKKTKIMASGPIISRQIDGEKVEAVTDFIFLGSKITSGVTAAMKLKDACSLEGKLWQTQQCIRRQRYHFLT